MNNKHLDNLEDTMLLRLIHSSVTNELKISPLILFVRLTFKILFYGSGLAVFYYFILTMQSQTAFALAYCAFGFLTLLFAFNFGHDLSHNAIFKSKKLNLTGFILTYTMVGAHAESWRARHIKSHHFAPNVEHYDLDLQISKLIRVTPYSDYKSYHRFQHLYAPFTYTFYSLYWIFYKDFVQLFKKDGLTGKRTIKYYVSFCAQKLTYFVLMILAPFMFSNHDLGLILIAFMIMHGILSLFLLFTFFITHHVENTQYPDVDENGIINMSWVRNQILSSNDFHPFSKLINFIFGGFNNHIAHHLFPHISHVYYPRLNKILYRVLENHGIKPNRTTFFGGIISHLNYLKCMSKENGLSKKNPTPSQRFYTFTGKF